MSRFAWIALLGGALCALLIGNVGAQERYRTALTVETVEVTRLSTRAGEHVGFRFNDRRDWMISINRHIPQSEGKWRNLVDQLYGDAQLSKVAFSWFGSSQPEKIELKIGSKVPLPIAQAVVASFARTATLPIAVSAMTEDTDYGNRHRIYIGSIAATVKPPTSPDEIERLLEPGISHRRFLYLLGPQPAKLPKR